MEIKTCTRKYITLKEGEHIRYGVGTNGTETYDFNGVVFLSFGLVVDKKGYYTQITDIISTGEKREATKKEINDALNNLELDLIFDDGAKYAKEFINASTEDEILPIKYGKFKNKEELIKAIDEVVC